MNLKINLTEVRENNHQLPSMITRVSGVKRGIGMIRWRIPSQLQQEKEIGRRIEKVHRDMDILIDEMTRMYEVVNRSLDMYERTEKENDKNASQFI